MAVRFPTPARFPNKMTTNMAETTPSPSPTPRVDDFQLHECVFNADIKVLSKLLRSHDVSKKDKHENTPLHLAVMLGHKECVHLLLAHSAPVRVKNAQGWTPLAEAISYGDRQTVASLLRRLKQQNRETLEERRPALVAALCHLADFYLELRWDFHSWVPLVSRILPSDVCRIQKMGSKLRMDTTLVDFNDMKWERGDITFIFSGDKPPTKSLVVLDNKLKVYQRVRYEDTEVEMDDELDILMSNDIITGHMSTRNIEFSRAQAGWLYKYDKSDVIGDFHAELYTVHGLTLKTKKRREHLSDEDLKKNKTIVENFSKGHLMKDTELPHRSSLAAPAPSGVTWQHYISAPLGKPPQLGRPMVKKESSKTFHATLAMSEDFPTSVTAFLDKIWKTVTTKIMEILLDVLEMIAPLKKFSKLRDFMDLKLPPGFPVKIEIPVFPTVVAEVTFQQFRWTEGAEKDFVVPHGYHEDPSRFPDL